MSSFLGAQPSSGKPGALEAAHDVVACPRHPPHQTGEIVVDHDDQRPLIDCVMPFRDPTSGIAAWKGRVETRLVAVMSGDVRIPGVQVTHGWNDDLRREWQ